MKSVIYIQVHSDGTEAQDDDTWRPTVSLLVKKAKAEKLTPDIEMEGMEGMTRLLRHMLEESAIDGQAMTIIVSRYALRLQFLECEDFCREPTGDWETYRVEGVGR